MGVTSGVGIGSGVLFGAGVLSMVTVDSLGTVMYIFSVSDPPYKPPTRLYAASASLTLSVIGLPFLIREIFRAC